MTEHEDPFRDAPALSWRTALSEQNDARLAALTLLAILVHLLLLTLDRGWAAAPLIVMVVVGGGLSAWQVLRSLLARDAGADLLAAVSIVAAAALQEWLVAAIIVLMISGGEALEEAATHRASAVLDALARRTPSLAHLISGAGMRDVPATEVQVGDLVRLLPHELCPVDAEVVEGRGNMDESYLTGEPYVITKTPGSGVLSGAVNGEAALTLRATALAADSRYAQIVGILESAERDRPAMRRLADRLGIWYTVAALGLGLLGWLISGEASRFLAVVVVATPCPLLLAVPVAIIGAISRAAKHGIIVKNPAALEHISRCDTVIFDKTGTLTYGRPSLTSVLASAEHQPEDLLSLAAALETYSRHPLASAIVAAADDAGLDPRTLEVTRVTERPGEGLTGDVAGREVRITSRRAALSRDPACALALPSATVGLEAAILIDGRYAGLIVMRDEPRAEAEAFISHLRPRHGASRTMIISGDRESEVDYLARRVGIDVVHAGQSPEQKLALVRAETEGRTTLYLGDGINDAPAMTAASIAVAFGQGNDITAAAADVVVLDSSLARVDELIHIGGRLRRIALQSALGGIAASVVGMGLAVAGLLPPLAGAIAQEVIDVLAILNATRTSLGNRTLADYDQVPADSLELTASSAG